MHAKLIYVIERKPPPSGHSDFQGSVNPLS
jgi:hypothetical protein